MQASKETDRRKERRGLRNLYFLRYNNIKEECIVLYLEQEISSSSDIELFCSQLNLKSCFAFFGMSNTQQFGATNKEYIEATYIQKKKKN